MAKVFTPALLSRTEAVIPSEFYLNLHSGVSSFFNGSVVNMIKAAGRKGEQ